MKERNLADKGPVDELWSTWDTILIEWNKGGKKKIPAVKVSRLFNSSISHPVSIVFNFLEQY